MELTAAIGSGEIIKTIDRACWIFSTEMKRLDVDPRRGIPLPYQTSARAEHIDMVRVRNERRPNFPSILRQCAATGVRLVDMLTAPIEAARSAGQLLPPHGVASGKSHKREPSFHRHVSQRLRRELRKPTNQRILPYPAMLRELGISDGYLQHRFRQLTLEYRRRWHDEFEASEREEASRICDYLMSIVHLYPSAEFPRQKFLVEAAARHCGCGKRRARLALSRLLKERREASRLPDEVAPPGN
jgi:hypothetical protein